MQKIEEIMGGFPTHWYQEMNQMPGELKNSLEEIRVRIGKPVFLYARGREYVLECTRKHPVDKEILNDICNHLFHHSVYAYQEALSNGYITMDCGHRVGFCGKVVLEGNRIKTIKDVSSLNIRRAKEIPGISDRCYPYLFDGQGYFLKNIIVSPPKCGKTTLLRDLIRNLSGKGFRMGVCDERNEIAGATEKGFSYDLGERTDVLSGCPKEKGMMMLIRSMAPDIIATDEIGRKEDCYAISSAVRAGIGLLTTIHGKGISDLESSEIGSLVRQGIFPRIICLSDSPRTGTITGIYSANRKALAGAL